MSFNSESSDDQPQMYSSGDKTPTANSVSTDVSDPSSVENGARFVPRPLHPTPQNMKAFRRELSRQIKKVPVTESMLKEALNVFDIEVGHRALNSEVLIALEQLFGLETVQWPDELEHMAMISTKVHISLRRLLRKYGYGVFTDYGENGKGRLEIMPAPGKAPPILPEWLQIPFLVPVKGVKFGIIPDRCLNPGIQPGQPLHGISDGSLTHNSSMVGTLGTVMTSRNTYVALTAGHILNDLQYKILVKESPHNTMVELKVATNSVRVDGRPRGRRYKPAGFRDDCAFLKIDSGDIGLFNHKINCLNCHFYRLLGTSVDPPGDPVFSSRRDFLRKRLYQKHIVVFKQGANSDLTMGLFVGMTDDAPEGWYTADDSDTDEDEDEIEQDQDEWLGIVRWISDDQSFTGPGDSGSLVFAKEGGITIPLGIHIGAPTSMPNHSIFISIETYCYEAESEGWELVFTE